MKSKILKISSMDFRLETENPYIVCFHHKDLYPKGDENQAPNLKKSPRHLGNDFSGQDAFSMYHGTTVPGFPMHPHRGFETVTVVLEGTVDHFDSKGSKGRYSGGDVQWFTTGCGCQHAEMFPLVYDKHKNPLELFQIWLNLPAKDKFVEPYYKMLWREDIPLIRTKDENGKKIEIRLIAGKYNEYNAVDPTPNSWASESKNHVNIMIIKLGPKSTFKLPAISSSLNRNLYFYNGKDSILIDDVKIASMNQIKLDGNDEIVIQNGNTESSLLLLEGEPIHETVVAYGPFVMNTRKEIQEAYQDYQDTEFGGWPWRQVDPVHERSQKRFAKHADGSIEIKEK